jgi:hypothetical protein
LCSLANQRAPDAVPVQRFHDRDARQHFRPVALGDQQQRFHRDLPIGGIMFGFRQRGAASRRVSSLRSSGRMIGS